MSSRVAGLAGLSLADSLFLDFKDDDQTLQTQSAQDKFELPKSLKQKYVIVPSKLRLVSLIAVLKLHIMTVRRSKQGVAKLARVVVFLSNCDSVEFHHTVLTEVYKQVCGEVEQGVLDCPFYKLHGDMNWDERVEIFVNFCKNEAAVLLCTDVAARGLDFPAISLIVQFDPPGKCEDYIHRVGRTARIGHEGEALLFLQQSELGYLEVLREHDIQVSQVELLGALDILPVLDAQNQKKKGDSYHRTPESHYAARVLQSRLCQGVEDNAAALQLAADSFRSYLRAYAHHARAVRHIFNVKQLHLGHIAHSFALKEKPVALGSSASKAERKRRKEEYVENKKRKSKKLYYNQTIKMA
eukprot:TRINITY_DN10319_c0_g1_i1.p2 TRINITY_DN10319_c0_g1~~TRINITY_DN10319_c0_g1_i1.p2  ORF type:complete len:396 (+),score=43.53 TRINITY_DN10319_c0_g1_i1:124-1188(+)